MAMQEEANLDLFPDHKDSYNFDRVEEKNCIQQIVLRYPNWCGVYVQVGPEDPLYGQIVPAHDGSQVWPATNPGSSERMLWSQFEVCDD